MTQTTVGGLGASMWASGRSHTHTSRHWDPRSRSVPPHTSPSEPTSFTPAPAPSNASSSRRLGPAQALKRLEQTCLRLRWKSFDLESSYQRTLNSSEYGFDAVVAERNFKVDFYEFYAWIEQALVLLQRIFGVEILPGGGAGGAHAYHHNVLQALSDADNPLHGVLGTGDVNHALWKAKELRNRWKDAAGEGETTPPLSMYNLQWVMGTILAGLEQAYAVAGDKVQASRVEMDGVQGRGGGEEGWDWMVEAMDWEA